MAAELMLIGVAKLTLEQGVKYLYEQAGEVLTAWRARRKNPAAPPPVVVPTPDQLTVGTPHPSTEAHEPDTVLMLQDLRDDVERILNGELAVDGPGARATIAALREVMEAALGAPITFAGEAARTVRVRDINVVVKDVRGRVTGVRLDTGESVDVSGVDVQTVDVYGEVIGVDIGSIGGRGSTEPKEPERRVDARRALDAESSTPAAPSMATCHVHAEMDQTLSVDQTATVEVTVSREAVGGPIDEAAAEGAAEVDPGKRLIIQVLPKANVAMVGDSRAEIDVPATGEPQTVYFDVRATDSGQASLWVVARQGQIPLVTLKLTARVALAASHARSTARRSAEGQASGVPQLTEPLHQLRISQAERGGNLHYEYEIEAPALDLFNKFESRPITGDPQKYVSSLHKRIEDRWLSAKGDVEEFTQELREFGGQLLDELMPEKLQEILWVNRRRFTSIQVVATEPFIPWELVHLRQPGRPLPRETRFLGQMGLVRWLYDSGWPPERLQVRPTRARYVIPDYPDRRYTLPEAQAERGFLEEAFGATAVEPQPTPVRRLISTKGAFDLLHFAGHGAAETDTISEARLLLQGRIEDGRYIEAPFTTTTVNNRADLRAKDGSRPLVVLNACQAGRLGYGLTGIGGFAQAFLNGGAGAFIGTQWSVGDVPARVFTETFYRKLLDGATVAEATVASRERARADGDATWLAYAVYAHPHARLVRQGA